MKGPGPRGRQPHICPSSSPQPTQGNQDPASHDEHVVPTLELLGRPRSTRRGSGALLGSGLSSTTQSHACPGQLSWWALGTRPHGSSATLESPWWKG